MFTFSPKTLEKLAKAGRIGVKILIGVMIMINLALLAPGVYFGLHLGHYLPIAVGVGMSLAAWAAAWGVLKLVKFRLRRARTAQR